MLLLLLLLCCASEPPPPSPEPVEVRAEAEVHPELRAQAALFDREILEPAPGVMVFVGYALANVVVLEGPEGVVVVDTTESAQAAGEVLADLRQRTDKPIAGLVLTHNHADHVFGGQIFVREATRQGRPAPPVWAQAGTEANIDKVVSVLRDAVQVRSTRMFGSLLPEQGHPGDGIGFRLRFDPGQIALARPTDVVQERATVELAGLTLELVHAPGETDDQLLVWLPEKRVLLPADNIYQAFPNLYTIRGTAYRDVRQWVASLDAMRDLGAQVLVPQHTRPVVGEDAVEQVLTAYRDAIQYVHDQTVRGINAGRAPDELAASIRLPPHLQEHPWLREHYGRVPWSVRSIYAGYLGWFDGRAATLEPLPPDARARRYAEAFASASPLSTQARTALGQGELEWAAELALLWTQAEPTSAEARQVLADAYAGLGNGHINANARNWYLTEAGELRGEFVVEPTHPKAAPVSLVDGLPLDAFMSAMPVRLRAEQTLDADWQVLLHFTDEERWYSLHVRRGVAEVRERTAQQAAAIQPDLRITTRSKTWKRMASGHSSAPAAMAAGDLELEGGADELLKLLRWFDRG